MARRFRRRKPMKVVYVSRSYTGDGTDVTLKNIAFAGKVARSLWDLGYAVICPYKNTAGFEQIHDPEIPYNQFLAGDIAILRRCDAIVMLPGWEGSPGARQEFLEAGVAKIPIFHWPLIGELKWIEARSVIDSPMQHS